MAAFATENYDKYIENIYEMVPRNGSRYKPSLAEIQAIWIHEKNCMDMFYNAGKKNLIVCLRERISNRLTGFVLECLSLLCELKSFVVYEIIKAMDKTDFDDMAMFCSVGRDVIEYLAANIREIDRDLIQPKIENKINMECPYAVFYQRIANSITEQTISYNKGPPQERFSVLSLYWIMNKEFTLLGKNRKTMQGYRGILKILDYPVRFLIRVAATDLQHDSKYRTKDDHSGFIYDIYCLYRKIADCEHFEQRRLLFEKKPGASNEPMCKVSVNTASNNEIEGAPSKK